MQTTTWQRKVIESSTGHKGACEKTNGNENEPICSLVLSDVFSFFFGDFRFFFFLGGGLQGSIAGLRISGTGVFRAKGIAPERSSISVVAEDSP